MMAKWNTDQERREAEIEAYKEMMMTELTKEKGRLKEQSTEKR
jgi:hypothetical protein